MGICLSGLFVYTYNHIIEDLRRRYDDIKTITNTNTNINTITTSNADWEIVIHE